MNLGSALGVATLGAIHANAFRSQLTGLLASYPGVRSSPLGDPNSAGQILASPAALAKLVASYPSLARVIPSVREAFSQSIVGLFSIFLVVGVLTLLAALLIRGRAQAP